MTVSVKRPLVLALVLLSIGCRQQPNSDRPNRVLDRPTDLALVCVDTICTTAENGVETCVNEPAPLNLCESEVGSCSSDNPHLVGFVANSERNEIAMFTKCSNRLVDMDIESPGYDFIPAGLLPTDVDASEDGCWVASANVGSCDLTVLDAPALAEFGLGNRSELGESDVDEPSTLVANVVPRTFDPSTQTFRPLGARPGQLLMAPGGLTQAPPPAPGSTLEGLCDPKSERSAYVSFPTCNLVAEVDLRTGNILQSRQFVSDGQGGIVVVDTDISPNCPVECPVQFDELEAGLPMDLPAIDEDSAFVQALALSLEPVEDQGGNDPNDMSESANFDDADEAIEGQRLFVGGLGSDLLFELPIQDTGIWAPASNQLALADAGGIKRIVVSPAVNAPLGNSDFSQFLYVVAGDGSTRVVGRELPAATDSVGIECETQVDPSFTLEAEGTTCIPVNQTPTDSQPPERRSLSRGPGIRPGGGDEVTDWTFRKVYEGSSGGTGPFQDPGTVAVGVTTGGAGLFVMIDQLRANGQTALTRRFTPDDDKPHPATPDPAHIMDVRLFAHSLWPEPVPDALPVNAHPPLVHDTPPTRSITSGSGPVRQLAPTLRRIDATYADDERASAQLGVQDLDLLREFYDEDVVRVAVHDYRSWFGSGAAGWTLEWEGTIPGTRSTTGRLDCEKPGWEDGTCLEGSTLTDDSATFCDDGVLRGDKLVLIGCNDDDACGDGRRCLRESAAGGASSGICISEQAYEEDAARLRQVCGNFISDPCGEAYREYLITEVTQNQLRLQSLDQPMLSYLATTPCEDVENAVMVDGSCECLPGYSEAACGAGEGQCCPDATALAGQAPVLEVEGRYICTDDQPDDGCTQDLDCSEGVCIDGRCRRRCENDDECVFRRLPGPECFREFVDYQVGLRNAFRVSGPGYEFLAHRVEIGPDGTCQPTSDPTLTNLLTSRLPLPPSDRPDDPDWLAIPTCGENLAFPADRVSPSTPNPCRIVDPRAQTHRFHVMEYEGQATVSALRYSNPIFSIVLDLVSLEALTSDVPGYDESVWPLEFVGFRRSRIPRGYRQSFGLDSGYLPFGQALTLEGRGVTYPIRIVAAPQADVVYVVDGSGPGLTNTIRGQVVRLSLGDGFQTDEAFTGVR